MVHYQPASAAENSGNSNRSGVFRSLLGSVRGPAEHHQPRLKANEAALRVRGVMHAALFGSRARSDATPDSDADIMIEIDPEPRLGCMNTSGSKIGLPACSMDRS